MQPEQERELKIAATKIRIGIITGVGHAGCGHPGGAMSCADMLSVLYFKEMKVDPAQPRAPWRDRLVLSKGHSAPGLYAALALRGFFDPGELERLRTLPSHLQGHPDMHKTPGVDMSSGSLGQGLSAACGMALSGRRRGSDYRVYAILGDGESEEGQVWEAVHTAAHYKLDNLVALFDVNGLQIDGPVQQVMNILPLEGKLEACGWNVLSIDGNDVNAVASALELARTVKGKPTALVCHTVKGRGVSFMENQVQWHGIAPDQAQMEQALEELHAQLRELEVN
ncbi:transketolase [Candidatus Allofournierella excrementavium]|uniref:transketolase n=1 Tax=Candidatus Allofournierella excrementavium TaxID=2838591 RepID=UPI003AB68014